MNSNSKGFSMIELIVVLAIVGIMAFIITFRLGSSNVYIRDTAREQVVQALRTARAEAIARDTYVDFTIVNAATKKYGMRILTKPTSTTYSVSSTIRDTIEIGSEFSQPDINVTFDTNNCLYNTANNAAGAVKGIVFNPSGQIDNVSNTNLVISISVDTKGQSTSITLIKGTGYVY